MNVELVKVQGHWQDIPAAASVSHRNEQWYRDPKGLLQRLYKWRHMEPFEFVSFIWKLKIPIFLERQLLRHRISSKVEESMRYVALHPSLDDAYIPPSASEPQEMAMKNAYWTAFETYEKLLKSGMSKEQARVVLPLGLETRMIVLFNARSFDNFLRLRLNEHAQFEMQILARWMLDTLAKEEASYELWKLFTENIEGY